MTFADCYDGRLQSGLNGMNSTLNADYTTGGSRILFRRGAPLRNGATDW